MSTTDPTLGVTLGSDDPAQLLPGAYIAVVSGAARQIIPLPEHQDVSVGRSRSNALPLDHASVSRLHVTLCWDGGDRITISEHGSRNGTWVDGFKLEGQRIVHSRAELRVGKVSLVVGVTGVARDAPPSDSLALVPLSPKMAEVFDLIDKAAPSEVTVLIVGETGAGKEVVARRIHALSARANHPFVPVNCAAIPDSIAETMLFGHEQGAFSGATERRLGVFEAADRGTVFLDEVGELSSGVQGRLLRLLQERELLRVGGTEPVPVHARILAATHRDVDALVEAGSFRQDLLYRLDVLRIAVPPLRERPEEIEPLARTFLSEFAASRELEFTREALAALVAHAYPGNVRELRNAVERAVAVCEDQTIGAEDLALGEGAGEARGALRNQIDWAEREAIENALGAVGGNQTKAAKLLGISRRSLIYRMERVGLKELPRYRRPGAEAEK